MLSAEGAARRRALVELALLLAAFAAVGFGLWEASRVQTETITVAGQAYHADSVRIGLTGQPGPEVLNLNGRLDGLDGALSAAVPDTSERAFVVASVQDYIANGGERRQLGNVGELATIRPDESVRDSFRVQPLSAFDSSASVRVARSPERDSTTIGGRVTNLDGDGLQGLYVRVTGPNGYEETPRTDIGGRFEAAELTPGETYTVRPYYSGFVFEPLGMPWRDGEERVDSLIAQAGAEVVFVGRRYPLAQLGGRLGRVKSGLIVRTPAEFLAGLRMWAIVFFASFFVVHLVWRYKWRLLGGKPWAGDPYLLPIVVLLSGLGMVMMVSVRDPLRDLALFVPFVQGVVFACVGLVVAGLVDAQAALRPRRIAGRAWMRPAMQWAPIAVAFGLFVLLTLFGTGPEGSDAKVNLGPLQPSELIKVFVVLGLAGLLATYHDRLLSLRQRGIRLGSKRLRIGWLGLPRMRDVVLMLGVVAAALAMFVVQSDVGPALILAATALSLYGVARRDVVVPVLGFGLMTAGFWAVHHFELWEGTTRSDRLDMMVNTWDNYLANGVQLAEAHWALATGALSGLGVGRGVPGLIPAGHTDMILAGVGEELGLIGLGIVLLLYAVLVWRGMRGALAARGPFTFFLGLGLSLLVGYQLVLIVGGVLGLVPLSGVVSPFVSYGRTSMAVNGLIVGALASISAYGTVAKRNEQTAPYRTPVRVLGVVLGLVAAVYMGRLVDLQALRADEIAVRPALVRTGDGSRTYVYNQRIFRALREIPRGTIRDRNGVLLATSRCEEVETQADVLAAPPFSVDVEALCAESRSRYYPLGEHTFYLIGDRETRLYQADDTRITALTFVEFDEATNRQLQGYEDFHRDTTVTVNRGDTTLVQRDVRDFREILPLMRTPGPDRSAAAQALVERDRDIALSLDAALQVRAGQILADAVTQQRMNDPQNPRAAAVVVDPQTGEVLAAATSPLPTAAVEDPESVEFDREMRDRAFGWRMAPASTFKALLAMTALRRDPDAYTRRYPCNGASDVVSMEVALIRSCNVYFQRLAAQDVGRPALEQALEMFEIEDGTADSPPTSLTQLGIGQGQLQASVADMAYVAATVANGGARPSPTLLFAQARSGRPTPFIGGAEAEWMQDAMRRVVLDGTARSISGAPVPLAGKTGTGQYVVGGRRLNRSWFIGFGPFGADRPLAIAVVVDAAGGGGRVAAPPAARILAAAASAE